MSVITVTAEDWSTRVLGADVPVLVDVWAPWCVPCRRVEPLIQDAAATYGDRLICARLDADQAPDLVAAHQILSLPTILLIVNGAEAGRIAGSHGPKSWQS